jgi:hypothetical protein
LTQARLGSVEELQLETRVMCSPGLEVEVELAAPLMLGRSVGDDDLDRVIVGLVGNAAPAVEEVPLRESRNGLLSVSEAVAISLLALGVGLGFGVLAVKEFSDHTSTSGLVLRTTGIERPISRVIRRADPWSKTGLDSDRRR